MVVPKKKESSNVISMVDLTHKSFLTSSRGLGLLRQTGLRVRALVLSLLLVAGGNFFFVTPGYLGQFFDFKCAT
jgi:hypothetical protein